MARSRVEDFKEIMQFYLHDQNDYVVHVTQGTLSCHLINNIILVETFLVNVTLYSHFLPRMQKYRRNFLKYGQNIAGLTTPFGPHGCKSPEINNLSSSYP